MRTTTLARLLFVAAAAVTALAQQDAPVQRDLALADAMEVGLNHHEVLGDEGQVSRMLKKKHKVHAPAPTPAEDEEEEEEEEEEAGEASKAGSKKSAHAPTPGKKDEKAAASSGASATTTAAPKSTAATSAAPVAPAASSAAPAASSAAPAAPAAPAASSVAPVPAPAPKSEQLSPTPNTTDAKIKGHKREGVIDHSSDGSAEIDKIDTKNKDKWVSVYNDPPLLVIKASLYAFIAYNDSKVCDTFNMTLNAVEQKAETNESFSYHVVTQINCTKDGVDETKGKFVLNFVPEGKRLLLTECGHREAGEILNWMDISGEVPQCMTPDQRKQYISQPMKHVHAVNGSSDGLDIAPTQTNFMAHIKLLDEEGVAIIGSGAVIFIALVAVIVVFVARKRKAQKDLERTIAGAKAEKAEEDDQPAVAEAKGTVERKGLMDSAKAKPSEVEEGSFVNSPSVRV
ncbi:TPA: hypothetical protein N0F65_002871 [Lagenidium giganteum]|uniref:Uncharacterized protein n=1 Tax=Lagenidium giganteum TaxID=4803 RepID=A0AAV2Z7R1_9STRA|nr:TPA: hypothetical protein N0F65_002871 [Lagenidium giganteum]